MRTPWKDYIKEKSECDDIRTIIDEVGLEESLRIILALRGLTLTIPKYPFKEARKEYILNNYDGTRYCMNKLALDTELSQRQVAKILDIDISDTTKG
jgi:hypothetical protein